jgi:dehydrogenase/reductase SDR family protein 12
VTGEPGRVARIVDTVLDRAVVPGYSRMGPALRQRTWDAGDPAPGSLHGRVVVVTGGRSGLGLAVALGTARLGATVHLVVRDLARGGAAADEVRAQVPGAVVALHRCDVSDLGSVRSFAAALLADVPRVDVLVHNAGTLPSERQETADGHELTLATHVLGPVLMTELLRPALSASGASGGTARVVVVSSGGMYTSRLAVDDPEQQGSPYAGAAAYARTKRMQVALAPLMQERWAAHGIAVHTMHPGWVDTPGIVTSLPRFHRLLRPLLRDAASGADTIVWLAATQPPPGGGQFWHDRSPRPEHYLPVTRSDPADVRRLWAFVLGATGLV